MSVALEYLGGYYIMVEYNTVIELAKDVKRKINEYNITEPSLKKEAYDNLKKDINEILSVPKNRSLIYKGNSVSVVFSKTLGQWRMRVWKEIIEK